MSTTTVERYQLQLRPHLLGWLKSKLEQHGDWCEYSMSYGIDDKESINCVHENMLKYRKDPDNKGTVKLLAEDIAATEYLLEMIDRSSTVPEQKPYAHTREGWKVLLLNDFHLEWLKDFLLCESKSGLDSLSRARSMRNKQKDSVFWKRKEIESKCDAAMMDCLLEIIDSFDLTAQPSQYG